MFFPVAALALAALSLGPSGVAAGLEEKVEKVGVH
jgi:hypothetical protein